MTHHKFPSWRYGPKGEAAVFESENDVPTGWHDHPSKHKGATESAPVKTEAASKAAAKKGRRKTKPKPAPLDL